jgi:hypothetical protein
MYARETDGAIIPAGHDRRAASGMGGQGGGRGPPMGPADSSYREFSRSKNLRSNRTESRFAAARPLGFTRRLLDRRSAGWIICSRSRRRLLDRATLANSRRLRRIGEASAEDTRNAHGIRRNPLGDGSPLAPMRARTAFHKTVTKNEIRAIHSAACLRRELTRDWDLMPRAHAQL